MRSLKERVADLDRGIRAKLRARAIPQRSVQKPAGAVAGDLAELGANQRAGAKVSEHVEQQQRRPVVPVVDGPELDWTHAPIAQFVRHQTRVRLLRLALDDQLPARPISLKERPGSFSPVPLNSEGAAGAKQVSAAVRTTLAGPVLRFAATLTVSPDSLWSAPTERVERWFGAPYLMMIAVGPDVPGGDLIRRLAAAGLRLTLDERGAVLRLRADGESPPRPPEQRADEDAMRGATVFWKHLIRSRLARAGSFGRS